MCDFSTEDVLTLARAILDDPVYYMDGDYTPYYYCHYCEVEIYSGNCAKEDFKHDLNCPVLIAQDILTGRN